MGQLEMASALRSMAAAALAASSANSVETSSTPPSTCESPQTTTPLMTTTNDEEVDQVNSRFKTSQFFTASGLAFPDFWFNS